MLKYFVKQRLNIVFVLMLSIITSAANLGILKILNMFVNETESTNNNYFIYYSAFVILYFFSARTLNTLFIYVIKNVSKKNIKSIVSDLLNSDIESAEKLNDDKIRAVLLRDVTTINNSIQLIISFIVNFFVVITILVYLKITIGSLALILSILILTIGVTIFLIMSGSVDRYFSKSREILDSYFNNISTVLKGFKEFKYNKKRKEMFMSKDFIPSVENYYISRNKGAITIFRAEVITAIVYYAAIFFAAHIFPNIMTLDRALTVSFVMAFIYILSPINALIDSYRGFIELKIAVNKIKDLAETIKLNQKVKYENFDFNETFTSLELKSGKFEYGGIADDYNFKIVDVNFKINSGEIVFIAGGNGSGKSTLGLLLTGLYQLSEGTLLYNNVEINEKNLDSFRDRIAVIFTEYYLFKAYYGFDMKFYHNNSEKYLDMLKITWPVDIKNLDFEKLSFGQRKRLALFLSLMEDKDLYYFDEWAVGQDPEFRRIFYTDILQSLKKSGKSIIVVTHDEHYFACADKVYFLDEGKLDKIMNKDELKMYLDHHLNDV